MGWAEKEGPLLIPELTLQPCHDAVASTNTSGLTVAHHNAWPARRGCQLGDEGEARRRHRLSLRHPARLFSTLLYLSSAYLATQSVSRSTSLLLAYPARRTTLTRPRLRSSFTYSMLPGQSSLKAIRDAQRIRAINLKGNLKGQQRLHHNTSTSSASGASSSSSSSARARVRGAGAPRSKSLSSTAAARAELAEEIQEARGELEDAGLGSSEERAPVDVEAGCSELVRGGEEGTAVEVPLEELVVPGRRRRESLQRALRLDTRLAPYRLIVGRLSLSGAVEADPLPCFHRHVGRV